MSDLSIHGPVVLNGTVCLSGSKNAGLMALASALLTNDETTIQNLSPTRDIQACISILRHLGHQVTTTQTNARVRPASASTAEIPWNLSSQIRASICFLGPLLARHSKVIVSLPGGCRIGPRPIDIHLKALNRMGAKFTMHSQYVVGEVRKLKGAVTDMKGPNGSSVTATANVLMASVLAEGRSVIMNASREPEICFLVRVLKSMGARIKGAGTSKLIVDGVSELRATKIENIYDRQEAATFLFAAAITRGVVTIENAPFDCLKPVTDYLALVGCKMFKTASSMTLLANSPLKKANVICKQHPGFPTDAQPLAAALAATLQGDTRITDGVFPSRYQYIEQLRRFTIPILRSKDCIVVTGVKERQGTIVKGGDVRGCAALLLSAIAANGESQVVNCWPHIDRGYSGLAVKLKRLGANFGEYAPRSWVA